jgi:hypothetical protein
MPDAHTFPQLPQLLGSDSRFAQNLFPPDVQTWPGGQQCGLIPGGGIRKPGLLSATCPGGQQSLGWLFSRWGGQQITFAPFMGPMLPLRIGTAHL